MREFVRTDQGAGWVNALPIVKSGGIFISRTESLLKLPEGCLGVIPAGTPFVRNERLRRETAKKPREEQRTHLIVDEGLHHLDRMCLHIRNLESSERTEMLLRREQIQTVGERLWKSGQLTFEDHERLTVALADIRTSFDEWKKNEHKRTVRKRIDTANAQRSKSGRFKPAPAGLTTFASRSHIRKRLVEVAGIHAAFGVSLLRVDELLYVVRQRLESVWEFLRSGPGTSGWPTGIERAMDRQTRSRHMVRVAESQVRDQIRCVQEDLIAQPYLPLAEALEHELEQLLFGVRNHRRKTVGQSVERARFLARRMRMLWYVETSLIHVLSFSPTEASKGVFAKRLEKAHTRVTNLADHEFDPELRTLVREYLQSAQTNVDQVRFEEARHELKRLTRELRVQPVTPGRKAA